MTVGDGVEVYLDRDRVLLEMTQEEAAVVLNALTVVRHHSDALRQAAPRRWHEAALGRAISRITDALRSQIERSEAS